MHTLYASITGGIWTLYSWHHWHKVHKGWITISKYCNANLAWICELSLFKLSLQHIWVGHYHKLINKQFSRRRRFSDSHSEHVSILCPGFTWVEARDFFGKISLVWGGEPWATTPCVLTCWHESLALPCPAVELNSYTFWVKLDCSSRTARGKLWGHCFCKGRWQPVRQNWIHLAAGSKSELDT